MAEQLVDLVRPHEPVDEDWKDDAACRGTSSAPFFPERGDSQAQAKGTCAICPVRTPCLEYALTLNIKWGIWGGKGERERQKIRARRASGRRVA